MVARTRLPRTPGIARTRSLVPAISLLLPFPVLDLEKNGTNVIGILLVLYLFSVTCFKNEIENTFFKIAGLQPYAP